MPKLTRLLRLAASPRAYGQAARDACAWRRPIRDDRVHLDAAVEWILRAQRAAGGGGVSAWYCLGEGWHAPYPETTGYLIPTCLDYAARFGRGDVREAALRMGEWTLTTQTPEGGVRAHTDPAAPPVVFNTGQCMLGWERLARETGDKRYAAALRRAGDWLGRIQDHDGKWARHTYLSRPHAYHARVAWPLLLAADFLGEPVFRASAEGNLEWCLGLAQERFWISNMGFDGESALTHTLAYTYRGLLESALLLDGGLRERVLTLAVGAMERLLHIYERNKRTPYGLPRPMPASFGPIWKPAATYSCVTGNAQIAILWLRVFGLTGDWRFVNAALKILDHVKACQNLDSRCPGIRGGVPSSSPIYGGYLPMRYLNWASKFFADALMLQMDAMEKAKASAETK